MVNVAGNNLSTKPLSYFLPTKLVKGFFPFGGYCSPLRYVYATRTPEWIHENHWILLYENYPCGCDTDNSDYYYKQIAWEIHNPNAIRLCDIPEMYDFITYFLRESGFNIRQGNSNPSRASSTTLTAHTRLVKGMPMLSCVNCGADYPNLYNTHWGKWRCPTCSTQYYAAGNGLYYWRGFW